MDYLRSCYYSRMRLFRDRPDITVAGRWHFCPPGAKVLPFPHVFASYQWDPDEWSVDPQLGEVPVYGGYSKGQSSDRLTGQHWCGSAEEWLHGSLYADRGRLPVDPEGIPFCCRPLPIKPGGLVLGGTGSFAPRGSGGVVFGGTGFPPGLYCLLTEAGEELLTEQDLGCLEVEH